MNNAINNTVMNQGDNFASLFEQRTIEQERLHRKQRLAATFRLFGKMGFGEGVAGHVTARDPEHLDHFWVNPMGRSFKRIKVSDLILVSHKGDVVEGNGMLNGAAFAIHSHVHMARPDVIAAAHTHSVYGKAWSALGRPLDPITQDSCAFYKDHGVLNAFTGVVLDSQQSEEITRVLGNKKAVVLQNHGLLTAGGSVEAAAWWYITMERSCQAQLLAEAAGTVKPIEPAHAQNTFDIVGQETAGLFSFQPLFEDICYEQPDLFE